MALVPLIVHLFLQQPEYEDISIEGWTLHIRKQMVGMPETNRALVLLRTQLKEVIRVVPTEARKQIQQVPLWFSPESPNKPPGAAYHPGKQWLIDNGFDPAMAKGIEFYNIKTFEAETRRMPNFALHELAHSYHDRFLKEGFENADIKAAFLAAKASKGYDKVERKDSEGRSSLDRAYAMTNQMEYFAELSEAYFAKNDFFPFNRAELASHDPAGMAAVERAWGVVKQ
jgi:hypothetical protein